MKFASFIREQEPDLRSMATSRPYHTRCRAVVGAPTVPGIPVTEVAAAVDDLIVECFEQPSSA